MKSSFVYGLTLLSGVLATPLTKRASSYSDADILNYALTLEHLEATFYRQGLAQYSEADFAKAGYGYYVYENLKDIAYDEKTHVDFLTKALTSAGATAVGECTYDFGYNSVQSFLATASILEGVGVSAYLGAAADINTAAYLTAAASILTVEARHSAYWRTTIGEYPVPQPFDDPLDFDEVYTLAAPFIVSCPDKLPAGLNIKAFPALAVTSTDTIYTGSTVTLQSKTTSFSGPVYASFATLGGPVNANVDNNGGGKFTITVPSGVHGQSYLVLTSSNTKVDDTTILSGPALVEVANTDAFP